MSPRRVAATNRLVWHVKIIVAATEFCRCDLSHKFKLVWIWRSKLVWIRATHLSDKVSANSLVATCVRICDKSLWQTLNHQWLVSRHVKFELVYISSLSKSIACTEQVSYRSDLSQQQCRWGDLSSRCVAAICHIVCLGLYDLSFIIIIIIGNLYSAHVLCSRRFTIINLSI